MKMKQKKVYLTVGIPASGKTTFIKNRIKEFGGLHISRDEVRFSLLKPEDDYFGIENKVFAVFAQRVQNAINDENGPDEIYVDATHISEGSRRKILKRLDLKNAEVITLFFNTSLETALKRNSSRTGRALVPESAMLSMYSNITKPSTEKYVVWTINEDGEVISIE